MLNYGLSAITALIHISSANLEASCHNAYGQPSFKACSRLLLHLDEAFDRFMSVPPVNVKPAGVSSAAWALRITLPRVISEDDCNIALLSIMEPGGAFTWAVDSLLAIRQTEVGLQPFPGILSKCVARQRLGGFRQIRKSCHIFKQMAHGNDSQL